MCVMPRRANLQASAHSMHLGYLLLSKLYMCVYFLALEKGINGLLKD